MINFHNALGQVDLSLLTPETIAAAKLNDSQTIVLALVVESVQARESAQVRLQLAKDRVRECQRVECDALAAHQLANPPPDRIDALRANIAAYNNAPQQVAVPTSHPKHAIVKPRLAYAKAQLDLADAQGELQAAMNHARACDKLEGEAMAALLAGMPRPTAEDVHRSNIARDTAAKMERVSKGLPPTEPKASTIGDTPIEQMFAARGKGNFGRTRQKYPRPAHSSKV
jgi:hypothetical protein